MFKKIIASVIIWGIIFMASAHVFAEDQVNASTNKPFETKKIQPVVKVLIKKIVVTGNSLLTNQELNVVVHPYEDKDLSFEDAQVIAAQLTNLYRKKGYFLVQAYVPYQQILNNTLQINVLEGKIGQVSVEGNKHYTSKFILYNFAPAVREKTFRYDTLEKYIMLLNEFPDLKARTVLLPGKAPGTTDIVLKVEDLQPNHIDFDYNNFGTLTGGEHQPTVSPSFGSIVIEGDQMNLTGLYPFPSKSTTLLTPILVASYSVPVNNHGTKLKASYISADVRLGQALDILNVIGNTNITTFGVSQPLARAGTHNSNLTGTFNIKSSHNFILNTQTSRDKIRSVTMGYDTYWVAGGGAYLFNASVTQGLGTLFAGSSNTDPLSSTAGAGNRFTKMNITAERFQSIGKVGYLLILKAQGQFAFSPLLTPEQFILGGPESVRGYRTAELAGDSGFNTTAEIRFPMLTRPKSSLQLGVFFDAGRINNHTSTAGTPGTRHLTGWGFGLRGSMGDATSIRADIGFPLDSAPNSTRESPVFYFDVSTRFL